MSHSILIALLISSVILAGFLFFSQHYRSSVEAGATVPTLAAVAMSPITEVSTAAATHRFQSATERLTTFKRP
jgi:hypothetical protein